MSSEALVGLVSERFWMLRLIHLTDDLRPHRLRDNRTHRLTDLAQLDLQLEDVGAPLTPVEDRLRLLSAARSPVSTLTSVAIIHQGAECLGHHDLVERDRSERDGDAFNEVDLILASPPLQDLPVGCPRDLLDGEVSRCVVADRIDGDAVMWVEFGVFLNEGAQYGRVRGSTANIWSSRISTSGWVSESMTRTSRRSDLGDERGRCPTIDGRVQVYPDHDRHFVLGVGAGEGIEARNFTGMPIQRTEFRDG